MIFSLDKNCLKKQACNNWIYNMVYLQMSVGNTSFKQLGAVKKNISSW